MLIHKLRPKNFKEMVGQDSVIEALEKQFESGRIPHFFLISGPSGTGKTTLSRILALKLQNAPEIDALSKYDISEINASDKNGVDDIRDLITNIKYRPLTSKAKIIIMDEAHQLTTAAQNALLKVTEDIPDYCCRFDSRRL